MAIFKKIQKNMDDVSAIVEYIQSVTGKLQGAVKALIAFFIKIRQVTRKLTRLFDGFIKKIINQIKRFTDKLDKIPGPLKVLVKALGIASKALKAALKPFEKLINNLLEKLIEINKAIEELKKMPQYKLITEKLSEVDEAAKKIKKLAKLLEKQQEWLEKAFPEFFKKVHAVMDTINDILEKIKKIGKRITDAIDTFIQNIKEMDAMVKDFDEGIDSLRESLGGIKKVIEFLNETLANAGILAQKIPGAKKLWEAVKDALEPIDKFIKKAIDFTGIPEQLKKIVVDNKLIQQLYNKINNILKAVQKLFKDFQAIWKDIMELANEVAKLKAKLKDLYDFLQKIVAFKWFLEWNFPNITERMREALGALQNPEMKPASLYNSNSLAFIVTGVKIDGQGIGNDWIIHFNIDDETYNLNVDSSVEQTIQLDKQVFEEIVFNARQGFEKSIHIAATELDPVYNDYGGMEAAQVIQINPEQPEQDITFSFVVHASGGDRGGQATITVQLKVVLAEIESVLLPLSNAGATNDGINYLEHALNDLRNDMVKHTYAPGLYANMHALDEFINSSELLLNKLKVLVMESPDDQQQKEQLITEFYSLIDASEAQIVPERADQFEASYYIELEKTLQIEEAPATLEVIDIFNVDENDFCSCDEFELLAIDETEFDDTAAVTEFLEVYAFLNSFNTEELDQDRNS